MSNDPLPLPEIWSDLPKGDAPGSARPEFTANGPSGLVLIDYAGGHPQSDSPLVVHPLDRAALALSGGGHLPASASAVLTKRLSDLTAIITQAEALLRAQGTLKGDVNFAVERIHDVALALRMRDVNAALCDTLEASVREVGDAVIRHEAAAIGALSAAALLGDIVHRIEDLIRIVAAGAEPVTGPSAAEATTAVDAPSVIAASASPAFGTNVFVAAPAPVAFQVPAVADIAPPIAREVAPALEAPAPAVAGQPQVDPLQAATAEVSADSAEEQSTEIVAEPLAYSAPARMAELSMSATADGAMADGVLPEGELPESAASAGVALDDVVSGAMPGAGEAGASLDALSDELTLGNEGLREPPPHAEAEGLLCVPAEPPAVATHLQDTPAEIDAAERMAAEVAGQFHVDETGTAETTAAEPVTAEPVTAELVTAEPIAAETLASESVAAVVAAGPADDSDQPIPATPAVEAAAAAIPAAAGDSDTHEPPPSAPVGTGAAAPETPIRRPARDPLAAFYGLSEEELIALFS